MHLSYYPCFMLLHFALPDSMEKNVENLGSIIEEALNICAPIKTFKVRENHKFGISEATKNLIKERDSTRAKIKSVSPSEKIFLHEKYKRLRNRINSMLKNDTIKYNNERVKKAGDENEIGVDLLVLSKS